MHTGKDAIGRPLCQPLNRLRGRFAGRKLPDPHPLNYYIAQAEQHQLGYGEFLDELLAEELVGRHEHQIQRKLKQAGFPYAATLEQFDWQARPELKRAVMMRYFDSAFVEKAGALILIGPSGLGKTHLAVAVGTRMAQLGYSVRFLTAQQLANQVLAAPVKCQLDLPTGDN